MKKAANPNSTGKRLCRLRYAVQKVKIGHSSRCSGAKSPFSGELLVGGQSSDGALQKKGHFFVFMAGKKGVVEKQRCHCKRGLSSLFFVAGKIIKMYESRVKKEKSYLLVGAAPQPRVV